MPSNVVQRKKQLTSALLESDSNKKISLFNGILAEAAQSENLPFHLPIRIACALGESAVVSQYLDNMSDKNKLDIVDSCLVVATYYKKQTVINVLQKECLKITNGSVFDLKIDPLIWASKNGDIELIVAIASNPGANLNICDSNLGTALHITILQGNTAIIDYLLKLTAQHRIDVNLINPQGWTPLVSIILSEKLSEDKKLEYVKKIVELGADVSYKMNSENEILTALDFAEHRDLSEIVAYLKNTPALASQTKASFGKVISNNNAFEPKTLMPTTYSAAPSLKN